jgi:GntR family transcriptional regulator
MELHAAPCSTWHDQRFRRSITVGHVADVIDYESGMPPYRQLAVILRTRIETGQITRRLPSDKTLMQEFGLALGTVRKAVALLRAEGLIETTPGWGSHVVPPEDRPQS